VKHLYAFVGVLILVWLINSFVAGHMFSQERAMGWAAVNATMKENFLEAVKLYLAATLVALTFRLP